MKPLFALAIVLASIVSSSARAAIFGEDTRVPMTIASPSADLELARATAIAVLSSLHSEPAPGKLSLDVESFDGLLCKDEKFARDPSLSYSCTGFLVGPDLIATAGHCMINTGEDHHETETYCKAFSWLFDYRQNPDGTTETKSLPSQNLYGCKEVIYAVKDEKPPYRDYALVKLDRAVVGRSPMRIASSAPVTGLLSMIGYPLGTPAKLASRGVVLLDDSKRESFITNLDAFEGNSGSPVFNDRREVVGILVGGTPVESFVSDAARGCQRFNHCGEDAKGCLIPDKDTSVFPGFQAVGSEVQRIAPISELIKSN